MDIKEVKTYQVLCPIHGYVEAGEMYISGNGVHCIVCKSHLGYSHDLPYELGQLIGKV